MSTPSDGRTYLRAQLAGRCDAGLIEDCELILSELLTNSVNAGGRSISVTLSASDHALELAVADDGIGAPTVRDASERDTSGRGLHIVGALATAWGIESDPGSSRVWVQLAIGATAQAC